MRMTSAGFVEMTVLALVGTKAAPYSPAQRAGVPFSGGERWAEEAHDRPTPEPGAFEL
jgi:hypothetical protein